MDADKEHLAVRLSAAAPHLLEHGWAVIDQALPEATFELLREQMEALHQGGGLRQHRFGFKPSAMEQMRLFTKPNIFEAELDDEPVGRLAPLLAATLRNIDVQSAACTALPSLQLLSGSEAQTVKLQCNEGSGGSFPHHYDNAGPPSKRKLTALFYLNPKWAPANGGELLLSPWLAPSVRVAPVHGRLVLFQSDTVLHRVLPSHARRYCFTIWLDGANTNSEASTRLDARKPCGANLRLDPAQRLLSRAVYSDEYATSIEECFAGTPEQMAAVLTSHHTHVQMQMAQPAFARIVEAARALKTEHAGAEVEVAPPSKPALESPRATADGGRPSAARSDAPPNRAVCDAPPPTPPRQLPLLGIVIRARRDGRVDARINVGAGLRLRVASPDSAEEAATTRSNAVKASPSRAPQLQRPSEPAEIIVCQDGHLGARATGGWVWEASNVVERALLREGTQWEGLRVTELGAGTGRMSLRLASLGAVVTATDRKAMLGLMQRNVALNQRRLLSPSSSIEALDVHVEELDWEEPPAQLPPADLVIGADVIYDDRFHAPLIRVLRRYAEQGVRCVLGWEERKAEPEASFLRACAAAGGLRCRKLDSHVLTSQLTTVDNLRAVNGERSFVVYEMTTC